MTTRSVHVSILALLLLVLPIQNMAMACSGCPSGEGHVLVDTESCDCQPCPPGDWSAPNAVYCSRCDDCDLMYRRDQIHACTPHANTECGKCKTGYYAEYIHFHGREDETCHSCTERSSHEDCKSLVLPSPSPGSGAGVEGPSAGGNLALFIAIPILCTILLVFILFALTILIKKRNPHLKDCLRGGASNGKKPMSVEHRNALHRHRDTIVQNLQPEAVLQTLVDCGEISQEMFDHVLNQPSQHHSNMVLHRLLIAGKERAFWKFIKGLKMSQQHHLAALISPATVNIPVINQNQILDVQQLAGVKSQSARGSYENHSYIRNMSETSMEYTNNNDDKIMNNRPVFTTDSSHSLDRVEVANGMAHWKREKAIEMKQKTEGAEADGSANSSTATSTSKRNIPVNSDGDLAEPLDLSEIKVDITSKPCGSNSFIQTNPLIHTPPVDRFTNMRRSFSGNSISNKKKSPFHKQLSVPAKQRKKVRGLSSSSSQEEGYQTGSGSSSRRASGQSSPSTPRSVVDEVMLSLAETQDALVRSAKYSPTTTGSNFNSPHRGSSGRRRHKSGVKLSPSICEEEPESAMCNNLSKVSVGDASHLTSSISSQKSPSTPDNNLTPEFYQIPTTLRDVKTPTDSAEITNTNTASSCDSGLSGHSTKTIVNIAPIHQTSFTSKSVTPTTSPSSSSPSSSASIPSLSSSPTTSPSMSSPALSSQPSTGLSPSSKTFPSKLGEVSDTDEGSTVVMMESTEGGKSVQRCSSCRRELPRTRYQPSTPPPISKMAERWLSKCQQYSQSDLDMALQKGIDVNVRDIEEPVKTVLCWHLDPEDEASGVRSWIDLALDPAIHLPLARATCLRHSGRMRKLLHIVATERQPAFSVAQLIEALKRMRRYDVVGILVNYLLRGEEFKEQLFLGESSRL